MQICHAITACSIKVSCNYMEKKSRATLIFLLVLLIITYYIHCHVLCKNKCGNHWIAIYQCLYVLKCYQCFDTVHWASGRVSGLMGCWCGYLFAYGWPDATASQNPIISCLIYIQTGTSLPRLSWKWGHWTDLVVVVYVLNTKSDDISRSHSAFNIIHTRLTALFWDYPGEPVPEM